MKKILFVLFSVFSIGSASANWTVIDSYSPVQCNNWGWVYGNSRTVWTNPCTPLSVDSAGKILTVDTAGVCGDNEAAWYVHRFNKIDFYGCVPVSAFEK